MRLSTSTDRHVLAGGADVTICSAATIAQCRPADENSETGTGINQAMASGATAAVSMLGELPLWRPNDECCEAPPFALENFKRNPIHLVSTFLPWSQQHLAI